MKRTLALLTLIATATIFAQSSGTTLPIVKAKGGQGTNINWPAIQKEEDADKGGPGFFYRDCSQGILPKAASSTLAAQGAKKYDVSNLADGNPMTAWVEGKKGYGIGEWFEFEAYKVNVIFNGYQATPLVWKNNSRVKRFKIYVNGKAFCFLDLTDEMGQQNFELPLKNVTPDINLKFRFEIVEVYKGLKWDDVAISHVDNEGCCIAGNSMIGFNKKEISIDKITTTFDSVNFHTGEAAPVEVSRIYRQWHNDIVIIKTENRELSLTWDHPLFFKDIGFASLKQVEAIDVSEINRGQHLDVLVIENGKPHYEKIINVEEGEGQWMYTLQTTTTVSYLANGFVTRTYAP